jgi:membrane protein
MSIFRFLVLFRGALASAYRHGALGYAKGAAYSALLSLFPMLTITLALLVQADAAAVARRIAAGLFQVAPGNVADLLQQYLERGSRPASLPVAAGLLALWAASGVTMSLMEAFQAAYRRKSTRGVVFQRAVALWLVVASILPAVCASALLIFGGWLETRALTALGVLASGDTVRGGVHLAGLAVRYLISLLAIAAVTAMLYYFGPQAGKRRAIWPGAWLAAALWLALTAAFGWYVRQMGHYNVMYGSIGAVVALCVWMYLLSLSAMIGCEFNARLERVES